MRVVIFTPSVGTLFGQERVIQDSVRGLRQAGHAVAVISDALIGDPPELEALKILPGLSRVNLLTAKNVKESIHRTAIEFVRGFGADVIHLIDSIDGELLHLLRKEAPVVYTAHSVGPTCPSGTRLQNGPKICTRQSGWGCLSAHVQHGCLGGFKDWPRRAFAVQDYVSRTRAFKEVDAVLSPSHYIRDLMMADGWDGNTISVLPNPVVLPDAPKMAMTDRILLCMSRLNELKGIEHLIRAVEKLQGLPWELWVVGEGPERTKLTQLTKDLGLQERVRFWGHRPYREAHSILRGAHCLIQPNVGPESFGLSVAEAMAAGVPVIVSDVPALNELVENEVTGLTARPGDAEDLSRAIERMLHDDLLRQRVRIRALEHSRARYSLDAHIEALVRVYARLTEARPRASSATMLK